MDKSKIYLERLFPDVNEKHLYNKLKINRESSMYITIPYDAEQITQIISDHLIRFEIKCSDAIITDATAGVGGDTISFAKNFKRVYAVEIDKHRYDFLINNIKVYKLKNVTTLN